MKHLVIATVFLATIGFIVKPNCDKLLNGQYFVQYDTLTREDFHRSELIILDTIATIKNGFFLPHEYKIKSQTECKFIFSDLYPHDTIGMTKFEKDMSHLGEPYYDITKISDDTLYFIYRRNPHIMFYSGKFIRKANQ